MVKTTEQVAVVDGRSSKATLGGVPSVQFFKNLASSRGDTFSFFFLFTRGSDESVLLTISKKYFQSFLHL